MKKHIKLLLRTLFSNNACVEAARTKETKYNVIAVIFVLFSLFFAAMPTCVTGFQQLGGNFIRGTNYSFDTAMKEFGEKTATFELDKNHKLTSSNWDESNVGHYKFNDIEKTNLICFVSINQDRPSGDEPTYHKVLEIYYCPDEDYAKFTKYVTNVVNNVDPSSNGEDSEDNWLDYTVDKDSKKHKKARSTSFIVFGRYNVQAALYPPGVSSVASSVYGDYGNTQPNTDLIHNVLSKSDASYSDILAANQTFFDQVYINVRRVNTWRSTGIILGVDGGVIILMGFMVWILTRGKNNPFRIYSFWDGQKIAYYASLTPGILALFGFLMSNMAMMLFILAAGVRIMWLSMRTLRYQAPAKQ